MDLAENLNPIQGYQNILLIQDVLTDFVILVPLKSKTAEEVNRMVTYCVLQQFNVSKPISDNGGAIRNQKIWNICRH